MIKAVVFDLDGVYFANGTTAFINNLQSKFGLSEDSIKNVYLKSSEMQAYKEGKMSGDEFWLYAVSTWGICASKNEIISLLVSGYEELTETVLFVKSLRAREIRTAVCTNNFRERLEGLDNRFHFRKNFDVLVTSYEEGIRKPDPKIFLTLANRMKLQPSEILIIDDREVNVESLLKLGFEAFLYKDWDNFKERVLLSTS